MLSKNQQINFGSQISLSSWTHPEVLKNSGKISRQWHDQQTAPLVWGSLEIGASVLMSSVKAGLGMRGTWRRQEGFARGFGYFSVWEEIRGDCSPNFYYSLFHWRRDMLTRTLHKVHFFCHYLICSRESFHCTSKYCDKKPGRNSPENNFK